MQEPDDFDGVRRCDSCAFYSEKVFVTEGTGAGKCFVDYKRGQGVAWVEGDHYCSHYRPERRLEPNDPNP